MLGLAYNKFMTIHAAVNVPIINQRREIPFAAIDDVVSQIIDKVHPQKIILFGSYAAGKPRPESDVDLLVVMQSSLSETEQAFQICKRLDYWFGLDLLVITPQRLAQRLAWGDSFLKEIIETGKILYETPDS